MVLFTNGKKELWIGSNMNLEERKDQIPDEFKQLAQDFSDNGFITTSLDNLINWGKNRFTTLDDIWFSLLCCRNDANVYAKI